MARNSKRILLVTSLCLFMLFGVLANAGAATISNPFYDCTSSQCPGADQYGNILTQQCDTANLWANCPSLTSLSNCIPQCNAADASQQNCAPSLCLSNFSSPCGNQQGPCVNSLSINSLLKGLQLTR